MIRVNNILLAVLMIFFIGMALNAQSQQKFVIIANNDVPENDIEKGTVKRIYNGFMTQWSNNVKIKPSYTDIGDDSFWSLLGTTKVNFNKFWTKRVFSGNGVSPIEHKTNEEVINYVNNISGAIGIISVSEKSNIGDKTKVLSLLD